MPLGAGPLGELWAAGAEPEPRPLWRRRGAGLGGRGVAEARPTGDWADGGEAKVGGVAKGP